MARYKIFRLIIGIVMALVLTFNAVVLPVAALEVGSVNETGSVEYIEGDRSALEPAESEFAEKEENTQNDSVGTEEDTQGDKKENIPQEGESGQEAGAPSENAGDAVSTNQEEVREDICPDPDTRVKLWGDWREAAQLPAPTGDRAEDMASAAKALLGYSLRGEDSGAFCWNRLLAEFCLDYAEVSRRRCRDLRRVRIGRSFWSVRTCSGGMKKQLRLARWYFWHWMGRTGKAVCPWALSRRSKRVF